jgi:hypothetical protein
VSNDPVHTNLRSKICSLTFLLLIFISRN